VQRVFPIDHLPAAFQQGGTTMSLRARMIIGGAVAAGLWRVLAPGDEIVPSPAA
jgi:hypothetical protein